MKIRRATGKDVKRVVELYGAEYRDKPYNEKWSLKDANKKVGWLFNTFFVFVLEIDGEVEGVIAGRDYLSDKGRNGFIQEVIVSSKYQGKGFGKALFDRIGAEFKKRKVKNLELMSNNKSKAYKIYKKIGFKEEKTFVFMVKKLK